eukprot:Seg1303.8 transcript_id=Seg1303.8/GoldUCD/mRNA.D3Y31 product="Hermansky-Pudlak syndrome 1 protein" protein_id=Seg1303.8/GoldUCD/D3Y31
MKLLTVFNSLPDILYLWYDEAYLNKLKRKLARDECMKELDLDQEDVRLNIISQLFSPLIASQKFMLHAGDPYSAIVLADGSIIAIQQFDELFFIALCADGEESEWFLHRKISFFHYLINAKYGPAAEQIKPASTLQRQQRWHALNRLLETWHILCKQEQMFLVESLERLHVNSDLNSTCLQLLDEALSKARREEHAVHSLLLVNNKLLGLYSQQDAPELKCSDILLLTVFVKERFRYTDKLVPFSLNKAPPQLASQTNQDEQSSPFGRQENSIPKSVEKQKTPKISSKNQPNDSPSSATDYLSAKSTPMIESSFPTHEKFHTPHGGSPVSMPEIQEFDADTPEPQSPSSEFDSESPRFPKSNTSPSANENSETASESPSITEAQTSLGLGPNEEMPKHHQISMFLKTADCPYVPHSVDFIKLDSATILVTLSEHRMSKYAVFICQTLKSLKILLDKEKATAFKEPSSSGKFFDKLDGLLKKLTDAISSQAELQYEVLQNYVTALRDRWESAKYNGVKTYLESEAGKEMPPKLFSSLTEIVKGAKAIFTFIFIIPHPPKHGRIERHIKIMAKIHELAVNKLSHYSSYLQVRGQRNVTMTAYNNDFPGLVHFIYVNRATNQLIAPSINQQTTTTDTVQHIIKQNVWEMWQYAENHVTQGFSTFYIKQGDFTYSYHIWFEDTMGKSLPVQRIPQANYNCNRTGVISGDFYNDLVRHCFPNMSPGAAHCYELFCIHIGIVSNRFVATSCKKLARQLFEASGEASSPIGLL